MGTEGLGGNMTEKRSSDAVIYTALLAAAMLVTEVVFYALANPQTTSERVTTVATGSRENIYTTLLAKSARPY